MFFLGLVYFAQYLSGSTLLLYILGFLLLKPEYDSPSLAVSILYCLSIPLLIGTYPPLPRAISLHLYIPTYLPTYLLQLVLLHYAYG